MPAFSSAASNNCPAGPDERPSGEILLVARLLADEHDRRVERAFAEHRLGRILVEVAARAAARILEQRLPRCAQIAARLDRAARPQARPRSPSVDEVRHRFCKRATPLDVAVLLHPWPVPTGSAMNQLFLRSAASLLPLAPIAAAPPAPVTPMTPDVVANYNPVLPEADYIKRVAMVPMRDGTKLYTVIVMKKGTANGPILLSRTPYDAKGSIEPHAEPVGRRHPADHVQGVRRRRLHHRPAGHPRACTIRKGSS